MIQITGVHLIGNEHLLHIEELSWVHVAEPGGPGTGKTQISTRAQMVALVRADARAAFAFNAAGTTYAFLELVEAEPAYVRTRPDTDKSDNLLSLPRY